MIIVIGISAGKLIFFALCCTRTFFSLVLFAMPRHLKSSWIHCVFCVCKLIVSLLNFMVQITDFLRPLLYALFMCLQNKSPLYVYISLIHLPYESLFVSMVFFGSTTFKCLHIRPVEYQQNTKIHCNIHHIFFNCVCGFRSAWRISD